MFAFTHAHARTEERPSKPPKKTYLVVFFSYLEMTASLLT